MLVPKSNFYVDDDDPRAPASWNALISIDRFGYLNIDTLNGSRNAPALHNTNGDGGRFRVVRTNTSEHRIYTKLNAGNYTIDFTQAVTSEGFRFRYDVRRGQKPSDHTVFRFKEIGTDYAPTSGNLADSLAEFRSASSNTYFRDAGGDLWMKVFERAFTIEVRRTDDPLPWGDPEIDGLFLVAADIEGDPDISALTEGMVINLTALEIPNVSVRAGVNSGTGSVSFDLSGPSPHTRTESVLPYALFGDVDGDFDSEPILPGQYTLVVTPYAESGASGTAGDSVTINFTVIQPVQFPFDGLTESQTVQDGTFIRAEEFDLGGSGVAYFDTTPGNQGTGNEARRDEDVDLTTGSIFANRTVDGEWLEFTRDVVAGVYDIDLRAWSNSDTRKGIRLLIAENALSESFTELGVIDVPNTNNERLEHTIEGVNLNSWAGEDWVFRIEFFSIADTVVAPVSAVLENPEGLDPEPYLEFGTPNVGDHWFNRSGLSDASTVETGEPAPANLADWPTHEAGHRLNRISRIRNAREVNTLIIDLDGTHETNGMVLWNSTESGQTDRGFDRTVLSYSTDGGQTYSSESDVLEWTQRNGSPAELGPEVQLLPSAVNGVTHIRMEVDNFSTAGADNIVMAAEFRFLSEDEDASIPGSNLDLNLDYVRFSDSTTLDYGDAPAAYATLSAEGGPRHFIAGPPLGAAIDTEADGIESAAADGDGSDDDGVVFGEININANVAAINIELVGASEGFVDAWIDFDRNGQWEPSEKILDSSLIEQASQTFNYTLPSGLVTGDTFARVRLSSAGGLDPTGLAADGEVEDYRVTIVNAPLAEDIVIAPVHSVLESAGDSYLEYGTDGNRWYDGSGLLDASIVDTGDPVPMTWPEHVTGSSSTSVSRIRSAPEFNTLTVDLGGTFDVSAMVSEIRFIGNPTPFTVSVASVVGRHIVYNDSAFDGGSAALDASDDQAIATDKTPLLANQIASEANVVSHPLGVTTVFVDIADLRELTVDDITVKLGNSQNSETWSTLTTDVQLSTRRGQGDQGSDRVTIAMPPSTGVGEWMQIVVAATPANGLPGDDVFYVGSAPGMAVNSGNDFTVNGSDFAGARDHTTNFLNPAGIENSYDFNRDGQVNGTDLAIARDGFTNFMTKLVTLNLTVPAAQMDENGDGKLTALDALTIINWLNRSTQNHVPQEIQSSCDGGIDGVASDVLDKSTIDKIMSEKDFEPLRGETSKMLS